MKKKIVTLFLAIVCVLSLVACGDQSGVETSSSGVETSSSGVETSSSSETSEPPKDTLSIGDLGGYKIGFYYFAASNDALSKQFHDSLDYMAEITNSEMVYYDMTTWTAEELNGAVESLVTQGCDAIICVLAYGPSIFQYMNENEVYYIGMTRSYTEEVALVTDNSEYCCGWIGDEGGVTGKNYQEGYQLAKELHEQGCSNLLIAAGSEGEKVNDERVLGIEGAAEEFGMTILSAYRGTDYTNGIADMLAVYGPQADGLVMTGGGSVSVAAIQAAGYSEKIKLAQVDAADDDTREYLEQGLISATYSGGAAYIVDFYMQLFNALTGADRLFNDAPYLVPSVSGFVVTTAEEWDKGSYCTAEGLPGFTPDELLALNSIINPGMTIEEREALWISYTQPDYWNIDDLYARMSAYKEA